MNEKKEFAGWWLWILVLVVITTIIFSFLTFGSTIMERMVFENSYQKQAGDQKQLNTWRAQLAAINLKLAQDPNNANLLAQKAMLEVQIQGVK